CNGFGCETDLRLQRREGAAALRVRDEVGNLLPEDQPEGVFADESGRLAVMTSQRSDHPAKRDHRRRLGHQTTCHDRTRARPANTPAIDSITEARTKTSWRPAPAPTGVRPPARMRKRW